VIIVLVCCLGVVVLSLVVLGLLVLGVSRRVPPLVVALKIAQERAAEYEKALKKAP
jgi:hypothetical protein